ncbi:glutathione S-transferase family protein [Pseudaestuariivita atlantica]|uniref:Glutathione S-transferase n=1 Tax=Pseudaestuariivita atlantica TaxID=1317121 RepID=A0A0L1JS30_9RHOB|nr:glutathione S-transferase N-terminal domain-containing protein [Pseudaestuariivita atlantica]KNG94502.1 glutathione S-transferase [Pseudaestuariivita atlantica]
MRLYTAPGTISIAVAIALHEAGIDATHDRVDFASAAQTRAPYLSINPKGRVPALELDDGTILTETGAILDYIGAIAPDTGLVPADALRAARMREVMYYLASTMHVNHAHKMRGARWSDDPAALASMKAKVPDTMTSSARYIEASCALDPFVLGADFSLADPYLFVICTWLPGDGVGMAALPRLTGFMQAMDARASVAHMREIGLLR